MGTEEKVRSPFRMLKQGDRATFGAKYRDVVLEIAGVATAQVSYITGCDYVLIERVTGGRPERVWTDIIRLEWVGPASTVELGAVLARSSGSDPPPRSYRE